MKKGFTLIELLVVIALIAVLSLIGFGVYSNLQKSARDTTRKADIDAIAQAYEENYNPAAGTYNSLLGSQFTQGTEPTGPSGTTYTYVDGPNASPLPSNTCSPACFKVCAVLEGSSEPYCRSNQQGPTSITDFVPPIPICNAPPITCSGSCSATCSGSSGTQSSCVYTTYSGGGSCTQAVAPDQSCTGSAGPICPDPSTVACGQPIASSNGCGTCTGTGTLCTIAGQTCNGSTCRTPPTYSENFTSGVTPTTQCTAWNTWRASLADTYTKITLKGSNDTVGVSCTGATANTICQNLRTGTTMASTACGGRNWTVGPCGGGIELSANGRNCVCESAGYTARPCIGNLNWGGINGPTCFASSQTITVVCE